MAHVVPLNRLRLRRLRDSDFRSRDPLCPFRAGRVRRSVTADDTAFPIRVEDRRHVASHALARQYHGGCVWTAFTRGRPQAESKAPLPESSREARHCFRSILIWMVPGFQPAGREHIPFVLGRVAAVWPRSRMASTTALSRRRSVDSSPSRPGRSKRLPALRTRCCGILTVAVPIIGSS